MFQRELAQTLIELIEGLQPPPDSGLVVTEAEIELPLESAGAIHGEELIFLADVPHSRWKAGFLPPVAMGKLRVLLDED
ncbi:MAG: hypothetical protein R2747_07315 [Pyrinomonadaceae bacterium]